MNSLCAICPKPGNCCKEFIVNRTFWIDEGLGAAQKVLESMNLPFTVMGWQEPTWKSDEDGGREYGSVICNCPKLVDGRCSIYATRPGTCRRYTPGADGLCVMHGIPGVESPRDE